MFFADSPEAFPSVFLPPVVVGSVRFRACLSGVPSFRFLSFSPIYPSFPYFFFFPHPGGLLVTALICSAPVFPAFLFPFYSLLLFTFPFLLSFFPRGGVTVLFCSALVVLSFLVPLSLFLPSPGAYCSVLSPPLRIFFSFSFSVISYFPPSFFGGMVGHVSAQICLFFPYFPFVPSLFLPPGWSV